MKYNCQTCLCGVDRKNETDPPSNEEIQRYRCPDPECPGKMKIFSELKGEKLLGATCYISDCGAIYDLYHFQKDENNLRCPFCQRVGNQIISKD